MSESPALSCTKNTSNNGFEEPPPPPPYTDKVPPPPQYTKPTSSLKHHPPRGEVLSPPGVIEYPIGWEPAAEPTATVDADNGNSKSPGSYRGSLGGSLGSCRGICNTPDGYRGTSKPLAKVGHQREDFGGRAAVQGIGGAFKLMFGSGGRRSRSNLNQWNPVFSDGSSSSCD